MHNFFSLKNKNKNTTYMRVCQFAFFFFFFLLFYSFFFKNIEKIKKTLLKNQNKIKIDDL